MKEVNALEIKDNVIDEFKNQIAIVCARKKDGTFNMCAIAWGSIGELWSKNVVTVYVKPIRYTDEFIDEDDYFTVTFFDKDHLNDVMLCGTRSGRDIDKMNLENLKAINIDNGITFTGYRRVYLCKKIYKGQFKKEEFIDSQIIIDKYYKTEPPHNFYIGEIVKVFEK